MHDFLIAVAEVVNGWLEAERARPKACQER